MKFTSLLKRVIVESADRIDFLIDTYAKPKQTDKGVKKPKLSIKELAALVAADPLSRLNDIDIETANPRELEKGHAGKYTQWLIKSYLNLNQQTEIPYGENGYEREVKMLKERFMEDLYKVTDDLKKFHRFKNKLPLEKRQFQNLTPDQLYDAVKDFDLTLATTTKSERKAAPVHPGAKSFYEGDNWRVVKIEDKGAVGKEAACFYGGNNQETRWCTSAPGASWFDRYIKDGPLYVILPNDAEQRGQVSQLPVDRYQFHFPSNQFMDRHDHNQDLVKLLSPGGKLAEIADYLKPEFAKGFKTQGGKKVEINIPDSSAGKFIAIYGPKELFDNLPDDVEHLLIQNRSDRNLGWKSDVLMGIGRFNNLEALMLKNCVDEVPETLCNCNQLTLLALPNNPNLKSIPACVGDFENLAFINLKDSNKNVHIPEELKSKLDDQGDGFYYIM